MPCFSKMRCASAAHPRRPCRAARRRREIPDHRLLARRACAYTEPSSSPMTPGADHLQFLRHRSRDSAPVDDTMRFFVDRDALAPLGTSEPVATTIDFVSSVCVLPSAPVTPTLAGRGDAAGAMKVSTLFSLEQESYALTLPSTPRVLERHHGRTSSSLGAETLMPILPNGRPACSNSSERAAAPSDGMQPDVQASAAEGHALPRSRRFSGPVAGADGADIAAGGWCR